jgi:hypothetical protein
MDRKRIGSHSQSRCALFIRQHAISESESLGVGKLCLASFASDGVCSITV